MAATRNIDAEASTEVHTCDMCFKTYQRRDLLLRHRKRCQRPNKTVTRRKACNACVQAKAKCCYSQPTCSRCAKRGIDCQYVYPTSSADVGSDDGNLEHMSQEARGDEATDGPPASSTYSTPSMVESFEIPSSWNSTMSSWSASLAEFDLPLQCSIASDIPAVDSMLNTTPTHTIPNPNLQPPPQIQPSTSVPNDSIYLLHSPGASDLTTSTSLLGPAGLNSNLEPLSVSNEPLWNSKAIVRLLRQYPTLLLSDDFISPLLHRTLYEELTPDMTTLSRTSMAICCGSGLPTKESSRFVKRAIDTERKNLIEHFPNYQCMQQWDALHAMLLYEMLELQESVGDGPDEWKQRPRVKGLRSPFLLKMTRYFSKSHFDLQNSNAPGSSDLSSRPGSTAKSPYDTWVVMETARRTIFLANIVNFFSSRDHESGKQSPYYEPLSDDFILNLPLPCSHALWCSRTEDEWTRLSAQLHESFPIASGALVEFDDTAPDLASIGSSQVSLQFLLSKFTKDYLRMHFGTSIGFGNSDELRRLVVLCAVEQFS